MPCLGEFASIVNCEKKEELWSIATLPRSESEGCEGSFCSREGQQ